MPPLPRYKVFHIDAALGGPHVEARLEGEVLPYMRVIAILDTPGSTLLRVVAESRD